MQRVPVIRQKRTVTIADGDMRGRIFDFLDRFDVVAQTLQCFHH